MSTLTVNPALSDAQAALAASRGRRPLRASGAEGGSSPATARPAGSKDAFAQILRSAAAADLRERDAGIGNLPPDSSRSATQAHQAATDFVSDLFVAPMLAEMRQFPFGRKFGNGGRGEEVFGEQLDQRIAVEVAASGLRGFTEQVAAQMQRHGAPPTAATQSTVAAGAARPPESEFNQRHEPRPSENGLDRPPVRGQARSLTVAVRSGERIAIEDANTSGPIAWPGES